MNGAQAHDGRPGARIVCEGLWKIFGPREERYVDAIQRSPGPPELDDHAVAAVKNISFEVSPAETFVVMGLSGSGKSTLIRCMTRLVEPTTGRVSIDGRCVTDMNASELREFRRQQCAMVFQHFGLFPHRRVLDNAAYGLEVTGVDRAVRERRARELLDLVGLSGWEQRYPGELSGGMKQRVGLARALAVDPQLLLFDEPFSALDPLIRRDLQNELLRLERNVRKTLVFITHDMAEALKLGDRIAIMRKGEFVQTGTPEEIILSPADDYVRRFVSDAPRTRVVRAGTVANPVTMLEQSISPGEALAALADAERDHGFVIDQDGRPVGALSASEARVAAEHGMADVAAVVGAIPVVGAEQVLDDVMRILSQGKERVAVVDDSGRLAGAVDARGVVQALVPDPHEQAPD